MFKSFLKQLDAAVDAADARNTRKITYRFEVEVEGLAPRRFETIDAVNTYVKKVTSQGRQVLNVKDI